MPLTKITGGEFDNTQGGLSVAGIVTAIGGFSGNISGNVNSTGLSTFSGGLLVGTGASISSPSSNTLTLGTNNTEAVRIDSIGNVAIVTGKQIGRAHI